MGNTVNLFTAKKGAEAASQALTPKIPKIPLAPVSPDIDPASIEARDEEARRRLLAQGRGISATLGGGSFTGDTSRANTVSSTLGVG